MTKAQVQEEHTDKAQVQKEHIDEAQVQEEHIEKAQVQEEHIDKAQVQEEHIDKAQVSIHTARYNYTSSQQVSVFHANAFHSLSYACSLSSPMAISSGKKSLPS